MIPSDWRPEASSTEVTVALPTIPPRGRLLRRAVSSVMAQSLQPVALSIAVDKDGDGPAETRNRALASVQTEWVAFLDDDDLLYPGHLAGLVYAAESTGADVVYPWYDSPEGDPFPGFHGPDSVLTGDLDRWHRTLTRGNFIPVTTLVRTEAIRHVGGFRPPPGPGAPPHEDWGAWLRLRDAGAAFCHWPEKTWQWNRSGGTAGQSWVG